MNTIIDNELKKLPKEIQNNIIINKDTIKLRSSNFSKNVKSSDIQKLEKLFTNNSCVNKKSLYDIGFKQKLYNFNVIKIKKGNHLYKTFQGFPLENDLRLYSETHLSKPSWFGNKYLCYAIARNDWGSIVSFKLKRDLFLIDYFDSHNLDIIFQFLRDIQNPTIDIENIINIIKISTGYDKSLSEQILFLFNNYKWKKIYIYTDDFNNSFQYNYCHARKITNFNPIAALTGIHNLEILLFEHVFSHFPLIDGYIKEMVKSNLDYGGLYYHEEIALKNSSILLKMKMDYQDNLNWTNWKIKHLKNYAGLQLNYSVVKFTSSLLASNELFALIKFYINNPFSPSSSKLLNNSSKFLHLKFILSFNVNTFINLNIKFSYHDNILNILNLIFLYKDFLDIIFLHDVVFNNSDTHDSFLSSLQPHFPFISFCDNGTKISGLIHNKLLLFASKQKLDFQIIHLKISNNDENKFFHDLYHPDYFFKGMLSKILRDVFLIHSNYGIIALVQLDPGIPLLFNNSLFNHNISLINSKLRILMLQKILSHSPDFIIGNFFFTLDDPETSFLRNHNYLPVPSKKLFSTPYNKIDHCFIKHSLPNSFKNFLLKCNFSNHLPLLASLPN